MAEVVDSGAALGEAHGVAQAPQEGPDRLGLARMREQVQRRAGSDPPREHQHVGRAPQRAARIALLEGLVEGDVGRHRPVDRDLLVAHADQVSGPLEALEARVSPRPVADVRDQGDPRLLLAEGAQQVGPLEGGLGQLLARGLVGSEGVGEHDPAHRVALGPGDEVQPGPPARVPAQGEHVQQLLQRLEATIAPNQADQPVRLSAEHGQRPEHTRLLDPTPRLVEVEPQPRAERLGQGLGEGSAQLVAARVVQLHAPQADAEALGAGLEPEQVAEQDRLGQPFLEQAASREEHRGLLGVQEHQLARRLARARDRLAQRLAEGTPQLGQPVSVDPRLDRVGALVGPARSHRGRRDHVEQARVVEGWELVAGARALGQRRGDPPAAFRRERAPAVRRGASQRGQDPLVLVLHQAHQGRPRRILLEVRQVALRQEEGVDLARRSLAERVDRRPLGRGQPERAQHVPDPRRRPASQRQASLAQLDAARPQRDQRSSRVEDQGRQGRVDQGQVDPLVQDRPPARLQLADQRRAFGPQRPGQLEQELVAEGVGHDQVEQLEPRPAKGGGRRSRTLRAAQQNDPSVTVGSGRRHAPVIAGRRPGFAPIPSLDARSRYPSRAQRKPRLLRRMWSFSNPRLLQRSEWAALVQEAPRLTARALGPRTGRHESCSSC